MAVEPPFRIKNMVPGMIMLWYGSAAAIPSGWTLCDGTMGTPDLRERFVLGRSDVIQEGARGGSVAHDHDYTGDGHAHDLLAGPDIIDSSPAGDYSHETSTIPGAGTTDVAFTWPSYHALCYIMKL